MKKFINLSLVFGIVGLALGVYYREATKFTNFYENGGVRTQLAYTHVHTLVLGMIFMLVIGILLHLKNKTASDVKIPLIIYLTGLISAITMMVVRGSFQVFYKGDISKFDNMLSGIAGLTHIVIGVGLIYLLIEIKKFYKEN